MFLFQEFSDKAEQKNVKNQPFKIFRIWKIANLYILGKMLPSSDKNSFATETCRE